VNVDDDDGIQWREHAGVKGNDLATKATTEMGCGNKTFQEIFNEPSAGCIYTCCICQTKSNDSMTPKRVTIRDSASWGHRLASFGLSEIENRLV
jgi:hypothetical protein